MIMDHPGAMNMMKATYGCKHDESKQVAENRNIQISRYAVYTHACMQLHIYTSVVQWSL